ncbi:MAG: hypothetical protein HYX68_03750 [Planctomycetes bacterium]|nr:hypothetical protein [Planctomycetota bacterium]
MKTETVELVNRGRGLQLSTSRITVMDVFYWSHRGYAWDEILQLMPALSRAELDVIADYINKHQDELAQRDRRVEEIQEKRIAEQQARGGIFAPPDENMTHEEWVARLREKVMRRKAEKNGEGHSG